MTDSALGAGRNLRLSRRSAIDLGIVMVAIAGISLLVKLSWREFTFFGDNAESFIPLWHMYGTSIRDGDPLIFDPQGWGAGNVAGEAAYGVFNPVTILNAIAISFTDRLTVASFLLMVEFLLLLGIGVYLLARSYGANRTASILVGVIAPFAGYTLYYEAGNWASGLMSIVWVVHFWWSARMFALSRLGPFLPFVFGFLAATVGNPYSIVGILIVLFAVGMELMLHRNWRKFGGLVVVGVLVGTAVFLTYCGLMAVLSVIDRPVGGTLVSNVNYLTPTLSDIAGLSSPTYLTRIDAWYAPNDLVPSAYLSWILLPLLPWMRWSSMASWRPRLSVLIAGLLFLMLTLGPDHLWLFRWPIRFIEYLYLCVLIIFAVVLSTGLARTRLALRTVLSMTAIAVGAYLAFSSRPELLQQHLLVAGIIVLLVIVVRATVNSPHGRRWLLAIGIIGTAIITPIQANLFGWSHQPVAPGVDQRPPAALSTVRDAWKDIHGRVLQIADIEDLEGTDAVAEGQLVFGNIGRAAGIDILNRYTGINFQAFKDGMGFDYRGSVSVYFPIERLWQPISDEHSVDVVDALGVDTVVISTAREDIDSVDERPADWKISEQSQHRIVLVRDEPLDHPALSPSKGVQVSDASSVGVDLGFSVASPDGGHVILDRLDWPGYEITLDGVRLESSMTPYGLIQVEIPPGADGTVNVNYRFPGLALGVALAVLGVLGASAYQAVWWWSRRKARGTQSSR